MRKLKALVVDDERLARRRLHRLLSLDPGVDSVEACGRVSQARETIARRTPDVIFTDVQMPRATGLDLARDLSGASIAVVFVTAYENYALRAFDVEACDYLLKPIDGERLRVALQRVRTRLGVGAEISASPSADCVLVRADGRVLRIPLDVIDWIEASGNYVLLHVGSESHLVRETVTAFEQKLSQARFARIHRAVIVNVDRIAEFEPTPSGDFSVTLRGGTRLRMSRGYRSRIRDLFGQPI